MAPYCPLMGPRRAASALLEHVGLLSLNNRKAGSGQASSTFSAATEQLPGAPDRDGAPWRGR